MRKRLRVKLLEVKTELQRRRHLSIPEQGHWLGAVVRGHANYYGVPGNLATRWLPPAKITHPWPENRFDVRIRGKSPVR